MRILGALLFTLLVISVSSCRRGPPRFTVMLLDVSKSITPEAVTREFRMADAVVDGMKRGDTLTIIPITGDALSETPGRELRFSVPLQREPYDHDLVVFQQQAHRAIQGMRSTAIANPSNKTDILGALDVAMQEFNTDLSSGRKDSKELVVLSDLLEDDGETCFASDRGMAEPTTASSLADTLSAGRVSFTATISASIWPLESGEFGHLAKGRQRAVMAFWKRYLGAITHHTVAIRVSGVS